MTSECGDYRIYEVLADIVLLSEAPSESKESDRVNFLPNTNPGKLKLPRCRYAAQSHTFTNLGS